MDNSKKKDDSKKKNEELLKKLLAAQKDLKDEKEYKAEIQDYLMKKLDESSETSKRLQQEMVKQHGIWVTMKEAAAIVKRSRSTMYMYKNNDLIIYRQNDRVISVYTRSLIFVL